MGVRLDLMKRGRTCKLFIFPRADGVWFLVRRGEGCPRQVQERDGRFVAVCGNVPAECEPIPLTKTELAVLALDRNAALGPSWRACVPRRRSRPPASPRSKGCCPSGSWSAAWGEPWW